MKFFTFLIFINFLKTLDIHPSFDNINIDNKPTKLSCSLELFKISLETKENISQKIIKNKTTINNMESLKSATRLLQEDNDNEDEDEDDQENDEFIDQEDLQQFSKSRLKKDQGKKQEYVEWSTPKKLIKIIKNLNNKDKQKKRDTRISNKFTNENLLSKYKQIFLGFDFQINFKCKSNGSYFNVVNNFQIDCNKNNRFMIYILEQDKKRRKILINMDEFFILGEAGTEIKPKHEFQHYFDVNKKPRFIIHEDQCELVISNVLIFLGKFIFLILLQLIQ